MCVLQAWMSWGWAIKTPLLELATSLVKGVKFAPFYSAGTSPMSSCPSSFQEWGGEDESLEQAAFIFLSSAQPLL